MSASSVSAGIHFSCSEPGAARDPQRHGVFSRRCQLAKVFESHPRDAGRSGRFDHHYS